MNDSSNSQPGDMDPPDFDPTDYEPFTLRDLRGRPEEGGAYWMHENGNVMECLLCGQQTRREYDIANKFCDLCRRRLGRTDLAEHPCWRKPVDSEHAYARKDASIERDRSYVLGRFELACRRLISSPANRAALAWSWVWLRALHNSMNRHIQ